MPLLLKYLNLSLMKPFPSHKSKYLTMSCSDKIGTKIVYLAILEMISTTYNSTFFPKEIENIFVEIV